MALCHIIFLKIRLDYIPHLRLSSLQEAWERTIEMLDTSDIKGKTILDVGCNQGGFLRKLYDTTPFKEGVGIDYVSSISIVLSQAS
jgi:2-polyprenyl-3-methyl-5-hydroxy-6-metoxy-1,4-benzoquinol methylase